MGGVCSGGMVRKDREKKAVEHIKNKGFSGKLKSVGSFAKQKKDNDDFQTYDEEINVNEKMPQHNLFDSGELHPLSISCELKPSTPARTPANNKGSQTHSFLGKAGIAGLEKAVEVLDTLGSSMTNLNSGGFSTGVTSRGNRISILAFEVANTIAKGSNLFQSLSEENIQFLKKDILNSEAVRQLVSTDMNELLRIAAADKREEFGVFCREVIRFGNLCKDPQWHQLDRFFDKLDSDPDVNKQRQVAEITMYELTLLAQHTSELYHESHTLDRFEQDYQRKLEEVDSLHLPRKGESLAMLHSELKHQRKLVRGLQKKSLWSKSLEQVVEKLVDIVTFLHQEISEVFGENARMSSAGKDSTNRPERLGAAGLALHYANIITQIDNIASRPASLPPNVRDTLYNGLPPTVKSALRSRLQTDSKELTVPQIKNEMEKTLRWLVPLAGDTTKAHQGFGWVGEWANAGNEFGKKVGAQNSLIRLQTLYHADKHKVESHILELVTWLHRLISIVRYRDDGLKTFPSHSLKRSTFDSGTLISHTKANGTALQLSGEDRNLLENVLKRKLIPGLSKSQELVSIKRKPSKICALSRSAGSSPRRGPKNNKADVLDILDGLDTSFSLPRVNQR